jgi:hypothetical protein
VIDDFFGYCVRRIADGNIALPGANNSQGTAYVFVRSGTTWIEQQQIFDTNGAQGDNFDQL